MMIGAFLYLFVVLRHKWFVLVAGIRCGAPLWRLLIHDWSKFTPAEFGPYCRRFYGGNAGKVDKTEDPEEFKAAWLHHQHRNPHHWEHWCQVEPDGSVTAIEMPAHFVREMVADWWGAGRVYAGRWDLPAWYEKNKERMVLHPSTRILVGVVVRRTTPRFIPK